MYDIVSENIVVIANCIVICLDKILKEYRESTNDTLQWTHLGLIVGYIESQWAIEIVLRHFALLLVCIFRYSTICFDVVKTA